MEVAIIHQVLADVLQSNISLVDEVSMQYMTDVLVDVKVLPSKTLHDSLATLLIYVGAAEDDEEATRLLHLISTRLCSSDKRAAPDVSEGNNGADDGEEPLRKRKRFSKPPTTKPPTTFVVAEDEVIALTRSEDPKVRKAALRGLRSWRGISDTMWQRIVEMATDPDANVRYQVVHNLSNERSLTRMDDVIRTLEAMNNDADNKVRRKVCLVLQCYYRQTAK
jgi:hypothetical protein